MSNEMNLPWRVELSDTKPGVVGNDGYLIAEAFSSNVSAHIVRCVNAHDTLVSALTVARNRLRDMLYQDDGQSYKEAERAMPEIEDVMTRFSKINQEMENAGLLHDKAHVDTGKVRAAQSVRTPEMSYRPGSLRMEDEPQGEPVAWLYGSNILSGNRKHPGYFGEDVTEQPLYTHPAPLRDLSDEEIARIYVYSDHGFKAFARAIIAAAKEPK